MSGEYWLKFLLRILNRFSLMETSVEELRTTVTRFVMDLIPDLGSSLSKDKEVGSIMMTSI